ncbi:hypothetical protein OGAPHI_002076 [Ogataea philodendri]|uniref:Uncharacterized protein n=1 Tax=Ogataea philodendri TaxID=1378263 RepID=A0A9P8PBL0_9ASCO|nr:uncharacterized protein OGAPHI_002076 [Ogataea philodendri]KAH3668322.1 hypothetical protein OGAPHI_002076 [Ogataea philodendri]
MNDLIDSGSLALAIAIKSSVAGFWKKRSTILLGAWVIVLLIARVISSFNWMYGTNETTKEARIAIYRSSYETVSWHVMMAAQTSRLAAFLAQDK